ncbi:hypothetical protein, partial [Klebsiella pneumoniae]|uniref:hypothetical protein n=1 Tax=Klebsiella pneumoniae TaxID=573 RepID=UPI0034DE297D
MSSRGNRVVGICQPPAPGIRDGQVASVLKGVYSPHRKPAKSTHPYLRSVESGVLSGQGVARKLLELKRQGFRPDVAFA